MVQVDFFAARPQKTPGFPCYYRTRLVDRFSAPPNPFRTLVLVAPPLFGADLRQNFGPEELLNTRFVSLVPTRTGRPVVFLRRRTR